MDEPETFQEQVGTAMHIIQTLAVAPGGPRLAWRASTVEVQAHLGNRAFPDVAGSDNAMVPKQEPPGDVPSLTGEDLLEWHRGSREGPELQRKHV